MNIAWLAISALVIQFFSLSPYNNSSEAFPSFNGKWEGTLTQQEGGYKRNYDFHLEIKMEGNKIIGRSHVEVDQVFAEMKIKGRILNNRTFEFSEVQVMDMQKRNGMDWCFKHCVLRLEKIGSSWRLTGKWSGFSSYGPCTPGQIFLRKRRPKA